MAERRAVDPEDAHVGPGHEPDDLPAGAGATNPDVMDPAVFGGLLNRTAYP